MMKKIKSLGDALALIKIREFKARGMDVVKPELQELWVQQVDLYTEKDSWYGAVEIEAALKIMEGLTSGESIEELYNLIDVQRKDKPIEYFDMVLSGNQNYDIAGLVCHYHERGAAFSKYRDAYVSGRKLPVEETTKQQVK